MHHTLLSRRQPDAALRLHAPRDRGAVRIRGRRAGHEPGAHRACGDRVLPPREGCGLQGRRAHDAGPAERRRRARPRAVQGVLRESRVPRGRAQDLPHPRHPRDGPVRALAHWPLQELHAERARRHRRPHHGARPAMDAGVSRAAVRAAAPQSAPPPLTRPAGTSRSRSCRAGATTRATSASLR
jgi:hypothetical protein